jgi:predicted ribosomally synthesized peptide with SipW-like signal peptide
MADRGKHRRARRPRLTQRVLALLALGVLAVPASVGTFAFWTDDVAITGTTFSTGTLDLRVNGLDTVTGYTTMNLTTMVPGNSVAGVLTVRNNGTVALKYTAVTAATNADGKYLRSTLVVKVTGDTAVTGTSPAATCAGTALAGTSTVLDGGLVTTGRLLAAATEEKLCVQVTLPTSASGAFQGATTNVTFTFTGTSDLT